MAKVLATIAGTALVPGVSKNNRLYTREAIASAVQRAQGQIAAGKTLSVLTHHEAGDSSDRIIGRITSMSLNEDGGARFTADIADTPHARTIASLADSTNGAPFLKGMSIRGAWLGKVRRVTGPSGPLETADDLEFSGIDPTHRPGVEAAGVDTFAWAHGGTTETTERVLITESVEEALVTAITEEVTGVPAITEAARSALLGALGEGQAHVLDNGLCRACPVAEADDLKKPFGDVSYADPGYQKDGKKRYPLDSPGHVRSAWSYVNQTKNASQYTAAQLKRIKGRIKAAMSKIGAKVAAEGWVLGPETELTEALVEYYGGDPSCAGSYSLSATNGPTTVTVCSYGCDPADLRDILAQACVGAGFALKALDPDMDGDIDIDQHTGAESPENPGGTAEAEPPAAVTETATTENPAPTPAAADRQGSEDPAVSETTTTETAATAPAPLTQADIDTAVSRALEAAESARAARKAAKRAAAAEAAPAAPAPVAETAAPQAPAVDIAALVKQGIAEALAAEGVTETVTESVEDQVKRLVAEGVTAAKQEIVSAGGGPGRKGLVTEHSAPSAGNPEMPADFPMKDGAIIPMEKWSAEQHRAVGAQLEQHVLGSRANIGL